MPTDKITQFIKEISKSREAAKRIIHVEHFAAQKAAYAQLDPPLPPILDKYLTSQNITQLFTHQAEAITAVRDGKDIAVMTPTASGKTLIYNLAVAEILLNDPESTALYLFPMKALAQNQHQSLNELFTILGASFQAAIYDGDTNSYQRSKIRKNPPNVILTNPDMLHLAFLPHHSGWVQFFQRLKFIICDEIHSFRGVSGSHLAMVLRRFQRICHYYGSAPQFIISSATVANPLEFIQQLTNREITVIQKNGAPKTNKHFVLYRPEKSPYTEASSLFTRCLEYGLKTIMFTKARKITELLSLWITESNPELEEHIRSYRAGYLPEERREIEAMLFKDKLKGVITTSALEVGIDVGGLDACILVGYPGTIISTWQRSGRVGRKDTASLVVLVGLSDPLDQYFLNHPREFFERKYETAICDLHNQYIVSAHLVCAASELPIEHDDTIFPHDQYLQYFTKAQKDGLRLSGDGKSWSTPQKRPQRNVNIRSIGEQYVIKEKSSEQVIGRLEAPRVFYECYPEAIYLHGGRYLKVEKLDIANQLVEVIPVKVDYYTKPYSISETTVIETTAALKDHFSLARIKVTEKVFAYERKSIKNAKPQGKFPLDLPPYIFETLGLKIALKESFVKKLLQSGDDITGGLHAVEHAIIAIFPLFARCDRWDLGGASYSRHPETNEAAIFIFDGHPGGIGLVEKGFSKLKEIITTAHKLIEDCSCEDGCPACIHSPKCGSGNEPLDKNTAIKILAHLQKSDFTKSEVELIVKTEEPSPPIQTDQSNLVFFDIETQFLSYEIGGWNHCDKMKLSMAVTYSTAKNMFRSFTEEKAMELLDELLLADLVVGFNINRFDYVVLQPYYQYKLSKLPTFDILDYVYSQLGFRLSLDHLAKNTLNKGKMADGIQAVEWYRAGEIEKLQRYCQSDVEITRDIYLFGKQHKYILYQNNNQLSRLPVDW